MEEEKKNGNRKFIVAGAVVAGLALIAVIGIFAANAILGSEAKKQANSYLSNSVFAEDVSYEDIQVNVATGTVTVIGARFNDTSSGSEYTAKRVSLSVPPTEALAFAQNPETAKLSRAKAVIEGFAWAKAEKGMSASANKLDVEAKGTFSQEILGGNTAAIVDALSSLRISADGVVAVPGKEISDLIAAFGGQETEALSEVTVKKFDFDAKREGNEYTLKTMKIDSPMVGADGTGSMTLGAGNAPTAIDVTLKVSEADASVRGAFSSVAMFMGQTVPENGPFNFSFKMDENGAPVLTIN